MEKETNKFKLRLSKIFSSSCITDDTSKVIDHKKQLFTPKPPLMDLEEQEQQNGDDFDECENLFSYPVIIRPQKQTPLLSCKPRCPESFDQMVQESCLLPRRKVAGRYSLLSPAAGKCPPVSPASPLFQRNKKKKKQRSKNRNKFEKTHFKNHNPFSFSSSNDTDWFSSDDEREEDEEQQQKTNALFLSFHKSISLSSDSETPTRNPRRRGNSGSGWVGQKMKDNTFAVVKSSIDPYSDFRTSMAEMIIEKQIFGEKELEKLLQCFLSLNSTHYHRVIVEVFSEIWDALFSYRSS